MLLLLSLVLVLLLIIILRLLLLPLLLILLVLTAFYSNTFTLTPYYSVFCSVVDECIPSIKMALSSTKKQPKFLDSVVYPPPLSHPLPRRFLDIPPGSSGVLGRLRWEGQRLEEASPEGLSVPAALSGVSMQNEDIMS